MPSDGLVSIVIPVYRSERCLAGTVGELLDFFETKTRFEIVLVNDGSPDGVQAVIDQLVAAHESVRSVTLGRNLGQHRATLFGFREARGEVVLTVDDDGQNPPEAALAVLESLRVGDLDVVYGRFEVTEQSLARRLASALNARVARLTLPNPTGIALSNVRALRGDLARRLGEVSSPYPYIEAMVFRMASRIGDVEVPHRPRAAGASSYGLGKLLGLWLSHVTSLSVLPLQIATFGSFGISALGFLGGIVLTVRALSLGGAPTGWLSLFCAVTFLFSVLFAFLGIVSAYLGRMYVSLNERELTWVRDRSGGEP